MSEMQRNGFNGEAVTSLDLESCRVTDLVAVDAIAENEVLSELDLGSATLFLLRTDQGLQMVVCSADGPGAIIPFSAEQNPRAF